MHTAENVLFDGPLPQEMPRLRLSFHQGLQGGGHRFYSCFDSGGRSSKAQVDAKAREWALRSAKLRFSRKLLYVAGLLLTYEPTIFPTSDLIPNSTAQFDEAFSKLADMIPQSGPVILETVTPDEQVGWSVGRGEEHFRHSSGSSARKEVNRVLGDSLNSSSDCCPYTLFNIPNGMCTHGISSATPLRCANWSSKKR